MNSHHQSSANSSLESNEEDMNIVALWLRKDPKRWILGGLIGFVAGLISMAVGGGIASYYGLQASFPIKLLGTPIIGASATEFTSSSGFIAGFAVYSFICIFWGVLYGHFVASAKFANLLAMGLVWGTFLWVFNWNLYLQSFKLIYAAQVDSRPAFAVCVVYGFSLALIGFLDRRTEFV